MAGYLNPGQALQTRSFLDGGDLENGAVGGLEQHEFIAYPRPLAVFLSLLVATSLSTASFIVQAGDTPQETVQPSNINTRDLKEGDRAPDMLMRSDTTAGQRPGRNGRQLVAKRCRQLPRHPGSRTCHRRPAQNAVRHGQPVPWRAGR